jgi:hypothetical protein
MLEHLFSSRTRVKLLSLFLANQKSEFFVRELTRLTDEQINSIRRELENLKKIGFLKFRLNNNKKYFSINKKFIILDELQAIFTKYSGPSEKILNNILKCGDIDLVAISGRIIEHNNCSIEVLVVGNTEKIALETYLKQLEEEGAHEIRFVIFTTEDFLFRMRCNDKFLINFFNKEKHIIIYDKLKLKKQP